MCGAKLTAASESLNAYNKKRSESILAPLFVVAITLSCHLKKKSIII